MIKYIRGSKVNILPGMVVEDSNGSRKVVIIDPGKDMYDNMFGNRATSVDTKGVASPVVVNPQYVNRVLKIKCGDGDRYVHDVLTGSVGELVDTLNYLWAEPENRLNRTMLPYITDDTVFVYENKAYYAKEIKYDSNTIIFYGGGRTRKTAQGKSDVIKANIIAVFIANEDYKKIKKQMEEDRHAQKTNWGIR